jgi:hypothetical protein
MVYPACPTCKSFVKALESGGRERLCVAKERLFRRSKSVRDVSQEPREKDVPPPSERYRAQCSVLLRTSKVDAIKPALANLSQLITKGILLSGRCQPEYLYNQLNEIKPGMIQEATKNARIAGEPFSRDSQTTPGKLKSVAQKAGSRSKIATPRCRNARWSESFSMWNMR